MLTIANKGRYVVKKSQKHVYVICEGSLMYLPKIDGDQSPTILYVPVALF